MHRNWNDPLASEQQTYGQTLRKGLSFFGITCLVATCGYVMAGWDLIDALYMVTITIFGVGYGEVRPIEEPWLKFFTMGVIFAGCSSLIYVIGGIVQMLAEGEIQRIMGIRNRSREIEQLQEHTIICGYGRVGQMLASELAIKGEPFVIVDRVHSRFQQAIGDGFLAIEGDAAEDRILNAAGIHRATALATVLPNDAINVFITLSARGMSDSVRIIARAESRSTEDKLMRSGANSVVMPAAIGAARIAQLAMTSEIPTSSLPADRYRIIQEVQRPADTPDHGDTEDPIGSDSQTAIPVLGFDSEPQLSPTTLP